MLSYMQQGGYIMWVIAAISVAALAVAIERVIFFKSASTDARALENEFVPAVRANDLAGAKKIADSGKSSLHRVFSATCERWSSGREEMQLLLEQQVRREIYRWSKNLWLLELAAKICPLLGLLGTVLGMVEMFRSLNVGGQISGAAVTGGIYQALFTTVAGLTAAIPITFIHGILVSRIDNEEETLNRGTDFLLFEYALSSEKAKNEK